MKKIINGNYEFVSVNFDTQEVKALTDHRSIEILTVYTADEDTTFELKDCVIAVAKGETVMLVKYYDGEYHVHYKVVPLEGVSAYDMLEIEKASQFDDDKPVEPVTGVSSSQEESEDNEAV